MAIFAKLVYALIDKNISVGLAGVSVVKVQQTVNPDAKQIIGSDYTKIHLNGLILINRISTSFCNEANLRYQNMEKIKLLYLFYLYLLTR